MAEDLFVRHNNSWFKFRDVEADGNCMYYCLAKCPATPLSSVESIRQVLAKMMRKPSDNLKNFFVEYHKTDDDPEPSIEKWQETVMQEREWGSNFESTLFGAIYGVDVRIITNSPAGLEECDTRTLLEMYEIDSEKMIPVNAPIFYMYLHKHSYPRQPTKKPNHFAILDPIDYEPPEGSKLYVHPASEESSSDIKSLDGDNSGSNLSQTKISSRRTRRPTIHMSEQSQNKRQNDEAESGSSRRRSSVDMSALSSVLSEIATYDRANPEKTKDSSKNRVRQRPVTMQDRRNWGSVMSEMSFRLEKSAEPLDLTKENPTRETATKERRNRRRDGPQSEKPNLDDERDKRSLKREESPDQPLKETEENARDRRRKEESPDKQTCQDQHLPNREHSKRIQRSESDRSSERRNEKSTTGQEVVRESDRNRESRVEGGQRNGQILSSSTSDPEKENSRRTRRSVDEDANNSFSSSRIAIRQDHTERSDRSNFSTSSGPRSGKNRAYQGTLPVVIDEESPSVKGTSIQKSLNGLINMEDTIASPRSPKLKPTRSPAIAALNAVDDLDTPNHTRSTDKMRRRGGDVGDDTMEVAPIIIPSLYVREEPQERLGRQRTIAPRNANRSPRRISHQNSDESTSSRSSAKPQQVQSDSGPGRSSRLESASNGSTSQATRRESVTYGSSAQSSRRESMVHGSGSQATRRESMAPGSSNQTSRRESIAHVSSSNARRRDSMVQGERRSVQHDGSRGSYHKDDNNDHYEDDHLVRIRDRDNGLRSRSQSGPHGANEHGTRYHSNRRDADDFGSRSHTNRTELDEQGSRQSNRRELDENTSRSQSSRREPEDYNARSRSGRRSSCEHVSSIRRRESDDHLSSSRRREAEEQLLSSRPHEADVHVSSSRRRESEEQVSSSRRRETEEQVSTSGRRETEEQVSTSRRRETEEPVSTSRRRETGEPVSTSRRRETEEQVSTSRRREEEPVSTSRRRETEEQVSTSRRRETEEAPNSRRREPEEHASSSRRRESMSHGSRPRSQERRYSMALPQDRRRRGRSLDEDLLYDLDEEEAPRHTGTRASTVFKVDPLSAKSNPRSSRPSQDQSCSRGGEKDYESRVPLQGQSTSSWAAHFEGKSGSSGDRERSSADDIDRPRRRPTAQHSTA